MPKEVEDKLFRQAHSLVSRGKLRKKEGDTEKEAINRYVYGTMQKKGLMSEPDAPMPVVAAVRSAVNKVDLGDAKQGQQLGFWANPTTWQAIGTIANVVTQGSVVADSIYQQHLRNKARKRPRQASGSRPTRFYPENEAFLSEDGGVKLAVGALLPIAVEVAPVAGRAVLPLLANAAKWLAAGLNVTGAALTIGDMLRRGRAAYIHKKAKKQTALVGNATESINKVVGLSETFGL